MRRRLLSLASAVSLLLCVATVVLWGAGEWFEYWAFADDQRGGRVVFYSARGTLTVQATGWPQKGAWIAGMQREGAAVAFIPAIGYPSSTSPLVRRYLGVQVFQVKGWLDTPADPVLSGSGPPVPVISINIPLAWPTVLFAALPLSWLAVRFLHRRAHRRGLCPTCSYNLTGNTSGVCPECGTAVKA